MSLTSNSTYVGYQAWAVRSGFTPSFDTKGPWFNYSAYADTEGTLLGIQARSTGKVYFEFNFRRASTTETEYCFGLVTGSHDPDTDLPGFSAESWAFCTEDVGFYHNSSKTTISDSYISNITSETSGFYYDYNNYVYRNDYVVKVAIDFDAGYIWFGGWNGSLERWEGDPAAGTDPDYTFTPNTPLYPAVGYKFTHTGFLCTAIVQLCCSRDFARRSPPSGFVFWDEFDYQAEVISDNPVGYWMACPHVYNEAWFTNSLGFYHKEADSSLNQKYCEHYTSNSYGFLTGEAGYVFSNQPGYRWYAAANSSFVKYPVSLSSTSSFTLEASVYITGAGAVNNTADVWTEGSGLVTNYIQANQQASWTLAQSWVGIALRNYKFKFHLREYEVTAGSDVSTGAHHIVAVFDASAQTLTLYIDGSQVGQTTGVTPTSSGTSWLAWGCLRPNQTNGNFPGYFRDCAFYPSALSSARVAAHYAVLASTDIDLAGSPAVVASASGDLTFLVDLAATATDSVSASGDLEITTVMGSSAEAVASSTGDLEVEYPMVDLAGNAQGQASATGDLDDGKISGGATGTSSATGELNMSVPLTADAVARAIAAGNPGVLIPLGSNAAVVAAATGNILMTTGLAGDAEDVISASGVANLLVGLSGSAASRAAAVAALTIGSALEGSAAVVGTVTGDINVAMDLDADAAIQVTATGQAAIATALEGNAEVEAQSDADLSVALTITGHQCYAVNLTAGSVTTFDNFDFERLVRAHGQLYGLKSGSLYKISAASSKDPGPTNIDATLRFAQSDFSSDVVKRLNYIYFQSRAKDGVNCTPIFDETNGREYASRIYNIAGSTTHRVDVGKGNQWYTLGMIITNKSGGELDIYSASPLISSLSRRLK